MVTDSGMPFETHCVISIGVTRETVIMVMLATIDVASKCLSEMLTLVHRSRLLAIADLGGLFPFTFHSPVYKCVRFPSHAIVYQNMKLSADRPCTAQIVYTGVIYTATLSYMMNTS